jgi:hypothetical protein
VTSVHAKEMSTTFLQSTMLASSSATLPYLKSLRLCVYGSSPRAFNLDLRRSYQGLFWPGGSSFCNFSCSALSFTESSLSCVGALPPA